jgi:hypothetical protein
VSRYRTELGKVGDTRPRRKRAEGERFKAAHGCDGWDWWDWCGFGPGLRGVATALHHAMVATQYLPRRRTPWSPRCSASRARRVNVRSTWGLPIRRAASLALTSSPIPSSIRVARYRRILCLWGQEHQVPQPPCVLIKPDLGELACGGRPASWRVGLNWDTGQGQYPQANGLYHALRHIATRNVQVKVWGEPNWHVSNSGSGSDTLDGFGGVWVTFVARTLDLVRAVLAPGGNVGYLRRHNVGPGSGSRGEDPFVARVIFDQGRYDFQGVWTVIVTPLP